jgi:pilus assembly protein Flp/PilA
MWQSMRNAFRREDGATAVEYGIMVALIAVVIVGAVFALGDTLRGQFQDTTDCIANPDAAGCDLPGDGGGNGDGT